MTIVTEIVDEALGRRSAKRWAVTGTDPRGEQFTIRSYRSRAAAESFAAECNSNGGNVKVVTA